MAQSGNQDLTAVTLDLDTSRAEFFDSSRDVLLQTVLKSGHAQQAQALLQVVASALDILHSVSTNRLPGSIQFSTEALVLFVCQLFETYDERPKSSLQNELTALSSFVQQHSSTFRSACCWHFPDF